MQPEKEHVLEYSRPGLVKPPGRRRAVRVAAWLILSPIAGFIVPFMLYGLVGGWGVGGDEIVVCVVIGVVVGLLRANAISGEA